MRRRGCELAKEEEREGGREGGLTWIDEEGIIVSSGREKESRVSPLQYIY